MGGGGVKKKKRERHRKGRKAEKKKRKKKRSVTSPSDLHRRGDKTAPPASAPYIGVRSGGSSERRG